MLSLKEYGIFILLRTVICLGLSKSNYGGGFEALKLINCGWLQFPLIKIEILFYGLENVPPMSPMYLILEQPLMYL